MRSHLVSNDSIRDIRLKGDRIMTAVSASLWLITLGFAPLHDTYLLWAGCATFLLIVPALLTWLVPGTRGSRIGIGLSITGFPMLTVVQTRGLTEAHFGFFIVLALLLYYRDWRPILFASLLLGSEHIVLVWLQMHGYHIFFLDNQQSVTHVLVFVSYLAAETATLICLTLIIRFEALESSAIAAFGERIIKTGTLNLAFDSERHRGAAARGLTNLLNAVLGAANHSASLATRISGISEKIVVSSNQMVRIAEQKIEAAALMMESVQSMSDATSQIKTDCSAVAQVASQSATIVSEGCETIQQTAALMLTVSETASSTVAEITQLKTESARIESIVEIMNDMASQSALLALNASIEAVRAGERGRGFQVVAQEIRTLSDRSYQSLSEVQTIVETIRARVNQLQAHADRCQSASTVGRTQVSAAHRALTEVSQHLLPVATRVGRVVQAADQQAALCTEVVSGMTLMREAMHTIADEVGRAAILSHSLEEISEALSTSVSQFHHDRQPLQPAFG